MTDGTPTLKYIRDYCRTALAKGHLTEEEHAQIDEWLSLHPDYEPHWELCCHGKPNQQGTYGLCVFGEGVPWLISYYNIKAEPETVARNRLVLQRRIAKYGA